MSDIMDRLVSSPACVPQLPLEQALSAYAEIGFRKFEAFTSWATSSLDVDGDPAAYVAQARQHGMRYTSMHLPPVQRDSLEETVGRAVRAARFAESLGAQVVLFKADSRSTYVDAAPRFLDAIEREGVRVTPVLQNHKGTPITTLEDFRHVIEGIGDPRMKTLLEVGHFHRAGVPWHEGYALLQGSIALVHINEIREGESVPFGTGEVDFTGLFDRLATDGYRGDIVVELELDTRATDPDRTLREIRNAIGHLRGCGLEKLA